MAKEATMATVPEYGEELLIEEREAKVEESSRGALPEWEDLGEAEVAEQEQGDEQARHPASENHAAHRPGAVCDHCGDVIHEHDDVRLTVDGAWVHDTCRV